MRDEIWSHEKSRELLPNYRDALDLSPQVRIKNTTLLPLVWIKIMVFEDLCLNSLLAAMINFLSAKDMPIPKKSNHLQNLNHNKEARWLYAELIKSYILFHATSHENLFTLKNLFVLRNLFMLRNLLC